jgi:hypothetical protein
MSRSSSGRSRKEGPMFVIVLGVVVVDMLSEWIGFDVAQRRAFEVVRRVMCGAARCVLCRRVS